MTETTVKIKPLVRKLTSLSSYSEYAAITPIGWFQVNQPAAKDWFYWPPTREYGGSFDSAEAAQAAAQADYEARVLAAIEGGDHAGQAIRNAALEEAAKVVEPVQHDGVPAGSRRNIAFAIRALKARETPAATVPDSVLMTPEHKLAVAALVAIRDIAGIYGVADNTAQDLIRAALEAHGEPTRDFITSGREGWDRAEAALAAYRATKETGHG